MKKVISNLKAAMKNAGLFLIIQSILYILLAGLLIAAVIGIYKDGAALRAEDPLAAIFSREIATKALRKIAPAFFGAVGITAAGLVLNRKNHTPNDPIGEALSGIPPRDAAPTGGMYGKSKNVLKAVNGGIGENKVSGAKRVRMVLLLAAIALIAAGFLNGSARDVFGKAVKICTECIGLG